MICSVCGERPHPPFGKSASVLPKATFPGGEGCDRDTVLTGCVSKCREKRFRQFGSTPPSLPLWGRWQPEGLTDEVASIKYSAESEVTKKEH